VECNDDSSDQGAPAGRLLLREHSAAAGAFMSFVTKLKNKFYDAQNGKIEFSHDKRTKLLNKFDTKCNMCKCCIKDNKFDIDHIAPLSSGGTNDESNLQVLCKACHLDKSSNENEQGKYIKPKDTASFFNEQVQNIMASSLAQTHAFVEHAKDKAFKQDKKLFCIDINKCRRNILEHSKFDYCLFTCFDTPVEFKGTKISPGLYYVELQDKVKPDEKYFPLHGGGWYYHNMIWYCIENNIITLDNIKFVIKSSLTIKHDYLNKFIHHVDKHIKGYNKLAINGMIGKFAINLNKNESWKSKVLTSNSCEAFNSYIMHKGSFIDVKYIGDKKYYHTFEKIIKSDMETEAPIYHQILQQEQIELHKLSKLIVASGGTVLDYNTDAINCIFEDDKFPFELVNNIQLNNHYWDNNNKVYKYKIEYNKERLKTSRMEKTARTDKYEFNAYYNWKITDDVPDDNFQPLVDKIIKSNQSWLVKGVPGSGKTYLTGLIQKYLTDNNISYESLAPTNLSALLINGKTLHKFAASMKKKSCIKSMNISYIFVDEFSMVHELFYQFLLTIK
jgi:DNA replication protein DnaC